MPHWIRFFEREYKGKNVVMSTCPLMTKMRALPNEADVVVQYLHTFPRVEPLAVRKAYLKKIAVKAPRYIFITAYEAYHQMMIAAGYESIYAPMAIDPSSLPQHRPVYEDRILWFGRVDSRKRDVFSRLKRLAPRFGYRFDYISRDRLNGTGPLLTQSQAWAIMSQYKYGIAVGRCALEMFAMGLKVFIAGAKIGGLIMNDDDLNKQHSINMNGRVVTFSGKVEDCLKHLPESRTGFVMDIRKTDHTANL